MNRNQKNIYCFISDDAGMYYRATQQPNGDYAITFNGQPFPISFNPKNIQDSTVEFATNQKYFSMVRSVTDTLDFIKDGGAILRYFYYQKKGIEQRAYLTIIEWNGQKGIYDLSYYGRIDFSQKNEDPKSGTFSVPTIDDSAWGVLSQNAGTTYSIQCSPFNSKAIRVLIDGVTLLNTATFQTVQAPIENNNNQFRVLPFVLVNQSGDSAGILLKGQSDEGYQGNTNPPPTPPYPTYPPFFDTGTGVPPSGSGFLYSAYNINNVNIQGSLDFKMLSLIDPSSRAIVFQDFLIVTNKGQLFKINPDTLPSFQFQVNYSIPYNFNINLQSGEMCYLVTKYYTPPSARYSINFSTTNNQVTTKTTTQSQVAYGLRPLDLLQALVAQATNNRFTIESNLFTNNNKDICLSGDSIRQVPDAKIYSSFDDFFTSFDCVYFNALRVINGALFMEKADDVYTQTSDIVKLGEANNVTIQPAEEFYCNSIDVGSPKQDYRHPSGRLEFNSINKFSLPFTLINKKLSLVSKYRFDCFGIIFLILDYQGQSTQDNTGDTDVFVIKITDDKGYAIEEVENFEIVTVDNAILEPIIKLPYNNQTITYNKPTVSGIAPPSVNVSIFVDNVLDGSTTSDINGNWTCDIVTALSAYLIGVHTGLHVIDAVYVDESSPKTSVTVLIDTSFLQPTAIIYPEPNDNLYNNTPLIKGIGQQGTTFPISFDGVFEANITPDNSGNWSFRSILLSNGTHTIQVDTSIIIVTVSNNIQYPLITYIGSELDGFTLINNLPLIKGIAQPGTQVDLWLNYIEYAKLNSTPIIADANGDWFYQVVPVTYIDPTSGLPVTLAPIQNGENVIIVTLEQPINTPIQNRSVGINVIGFKLSRPAYSQILGVTDNTVFNTEYSPERMLRARASLFAAIGSQLPQENIYFQTADKNGNLKTTLNGVTIAENADIPFSSLGNPIALLEYVNVTIPTSESFAKALYNFSNGGLIHFGFRGNDIYCLPIGSMKISSVTGNIQTWKLLVSPLTSRITLANLYKNGLTIKLMRNSFRHSDANSLHMVAYNLPDNPNYNFKTIYDDWFCNRNQAWYVNPRYTQKYQTGEVIIDQIISNGLSSLTLKMYRCSDAVLIDTIPYVAVNPVPIPPPDVVLEAKIILANYPSSKYFFVLYVDTTPVAITERIETKVKWLGTILIVASNSINGTGEFWSTGFQTIIRVEGLVKKLQPNLNTIVSTDEHGDNELIYSVLSKKRTIRFGTARGLPDYLGAVKVPFALALDTLQIESENYVLETDEKITPSDDVDGLPMYYYNVNMTLTENAQGKVFTIAGQSEGILLNVDGTAFGLPVGSLQTIDMPNR